MSNTKMNQFRNDPRLKEASLKAGCSPEEFFGRVCKNAGIKVNGNSKK